MMLAGTELQVLVATRPVDFRKQADTLAALVQEALAADPYSGAVYVFRAKRADRVKLLWWDGTGVCLMTKRLEGGQFRWPPVEDGVMRLTPDAARGAARRDRVGPRRGARHRASEGGVMTLLTAFAAIRRAASPTRAALRCDRRTQAQERCCPAAAESAIVRAMTNAPSALPHDVDALHALILAARAGPCRSARGAQPDRRRARPARRPQREARVHRRRDAPRHVRPPLRAHRRRPARARTGGAGDRARQDRGASREGRSRAEERAHEAAPQEPQREARPPAARGGGDRAREQGLPVLQRRAARDRRGRVEASRQDAGEAHRGRDAQAEARLPRVREDRCRRGRRHHPGAGAGAADRGRAADRAAGRRHCRVEVRRSSSALSAIADPRALRREDRALDAGAAGSARPPPSCSPCTTISSAC